MGVYERRFIAAADDLYAAFCESATNNFQREALAEFASASNGWENHPAKCEARLREAGTK